MEKITDAAHGDEVWLNRDRDRILLNINNKAERDEWITHLTRSQADHLGDALKAAADDWD